MKIRIFWISAFVFCCLQALMVQKLVLPLVPSLHAGHGLLVNDAILFHNTAAEIASRIKTIGWSQWSLFPANFTGNVGILSALYAVFGPEPAAFIPLNAAAHVTGALMLYLMGPLLWPGRPGRVGGLVAAILFAIFPSTLLWYSQNHKDAFVIAGALMLLYVWLSLITPTLQTKQENWSRYFIVTIAALALVLVMRPYLSILLAAAFVCSGAVCWIAAFFIKQCDSLSAGRRWAAGAFLGIVCAGAFLGSQLPASETALKQEFSHASAGLVEKWEWRPLGHEVPADQNAGVKPWRWIPLLSPSQKDADTSGSQSFPHVWLSSCLRLLDAPFKRISELRVHFIAHGLSVGAGSGIEENRIPDNMWTSVIYLPRALLIGALAPFPQSWTERVSLPRLTAAGETFIWYLFFVGAVALAIKRPSRALLAGVAFSAFLLAIFSYANPNIGTLYRVRFGYWMFFLLCGSVGWAGVLLPYLRQIAGSSAHKQPDMDGATMAVHNPPTGSLERLGVSGAAALLLTFVGFLGFLGRDLLLINLRGMDETLDVFFSAAVLPMVFVTCLAMPLADVLTKPFLAASGGKNDIAAANVARAFMTIGLLAVLPFVTALLAFPGTALTAVLGELSAHALGQGSLFLRIMTPILLISVFTIVGNAVLNGWKQSTLTAAAQLVVPICAIGAILLAPAGQALSAAAIGMLSGAALNAVIVASLCGRRGLCLAPIWSVSSLPNTELRSYLWLALAAAFTALAIPVNYFYAAQVGVGSVSAWAFAGKIITLFNSLFAFGVTAVVLPHLAAKFAGKDQSSGRDHFFFLLVAGTWIGGIIALALAIFAEPLVFAVFSAGGQLSEAQMSTLATVLRIGALQVPVVVTGAIVLKSVVVSGSSARAVLASFSGLAVNIMINQLLVPTFGLKAIAIGALGAAIVTTLVACNGSRARYGTSAWVSVVLLFGWLTWGGAAWAIEAGNVWGLCCAAAGLALLAIVHLGFWRQGLHHRSALRKDLVLP